MFSDSTKELNPYNVTDNNVGKTADEMFQEIGYYKKETDGYNIRYKNEFHEDIFINDNFCTKLCGDMHEVFTTNEVLACAQLIKEMEEEK